MKKLFPIFCLLMMAAPAYAQDGQRADFSGCAALRDEKAYTGKVEDDRYLLPGKDGWFFRTKQDLRRDFNMTEESIALFRRFSDALAQSGTDLIVVMTPTRGMAADGFIPEDPLAEGYDPATARKNYADFLDRMNKAGLRFVGTSDIKAGADYFYRTDHHWTTKGVIEMADAVKAMAETMPSYKKLKKTAFKTTATGDMTFEGSFASIVKTLCGGVPTGEKDRIMQTAMADVGANGAANALFDDMPTPEVVLVGTSNSKRERYDVNFEGALKERLSVDIKNNAISGGGFDDPLIANLASDDYRKNPAKILIWEIPGYYDLSGESSDRLLREVIASVHGDCGAKAIAVSDPVKISAEKATLLSRVGAKNVRAADAYLRLTFDAPVKKHFSVTFKDVDGKRENFKFKRSKRYPYDGIFHAAPEGKGDAALDAVTIKTPPELFGLTVKAQLCPLPAGKKSWVSGLIGSKGK